MNKLYLFSHHLHSIEVNIIYCMYMMATTTMMNMYRPGNEILFFIILGTKV
jgi:hypothetical protein